MNNRIVLVTGTAMAANAQIQILSMTIREPNEQGVI